MVELVCIYGDVTCEDLIGPLQWENASQQILHQDLEPGFLQSVKVAAHVM